MPNLKFSIINCTYIFSNKFIVLCFFSLLIIQPCYPQCTPVPVKEAVYNGDFEKGYSASAPGFVTDFEWLGLKPAYPSTPCMYGVGDKAGIIKAENFTCSGNSFTNNTYWAMTYGGGKDFKDHTTGIIGKGYALFVDLNIKVESTLNPGGKPIAWKQQVSIFPHQTYYFSAWVANFTAQGTAPVMQVTIIPYKASDGQVDNAGIQTLPAIGSPAGLMNWTQIYAAWNPNPAMTYNKVDIIMEFVNTEGGATGLDVVIDDISFINSCQNLISNKKPEFGYDSISICSGNGTVNLIADYPSPSPNTTVSWYIGSVDSQTEITGANGYNYVANKPGTYRICVNDQQNGCAVSAQVEITDKFEVALKDLNLCSPEKGLFDANPNPATASSINYTWFVPAGEINPGNASQTLVSTDGTYKVNVTGPSYSGGNCFTSSTAIVKVTQGPLNKSILFSDVCEGKQGSITIRNSQPGIVYHAFLNSNRSYVSKPVNGNGSDLFVELNLLKPGTYLIGIEARGCDTISFIEMATIVVRTLPVADAGDNIRIEEYQNVLLNGSKSSSGAQFTYLWTVNNNSATIENPNQITTTVLPTIPRTHFTLTVAYSDMESCFSSDQVVVSVFKDVVIPNVFSPNGDGIHDRFEIQNIDFFTNSIVKIFNQWGELIYKSNPGYTEPWDGKRKGVECSVSTYYYVIDFNEPEFPSVSGNISILR